MAVKSHDMKVLDILEGVNESTVATGQERGSPKCEELFALYVVLVGS